MRSCQYLVVFDAVEQAAGGVFADASDGSISAAKMPVRLSFVALQVLHVSATQIAAFVAAGNASMRRPLAPLLEQKRHAGSRALIPQ